MSQSETALFRITEFDKYANDLIPNPSYKTLIRWKLQGTRGVKLRAQRLGSIWFTCRAWVKEFIARLNADDAAVTAAEAPAGNPAHDVANAACVAAGF